MNVKELKKILESFDENTEVFVKTHYFRAERIIEFNVEQRLVRPEIDYPHDDWFRGYRGVSIVSPDDKKFWKDDKRVKPGIII